MLSSNNVASPSSRRAHPRTPGERVRAARFRASLTQEELAARAKKHINTIAHLEDGTTPQRLTARGWQTVSDVAQALETTPEALGYRRKRRVQARELTTEQREIIEDILALPKEDLAAVRQMLRHFEGDRGKGRS